MRKGLQTTFVQKQSEADNRQEKKKKSQGIALFGKSTRNIGLSKKDIQLRTIQECLLKQYRSLQQFYETNEQKLHKILQNQVSQNHAYLYRKQLISYIKNPSIFNLKDVNILHFRRDMLQITEFMIKFNTKKKVRQVQIIRQAMINRQKMIRDSCTSQQYNQLLQTSRVPFKLSKFTIFDEYKNIKGDFNLPMPHNIYHEQLYKKISEVQDSVSCLLKDQIKIKEKQNNCIQGKISHLKYT